jgi:gamma-butyrobetaine dioxygenase
MTDSRNIQELLDLLSTRGTGAYFGERVSILEHSLQCAYFAEQSHAKPTAVAAALLHDIGHLLHDLPENIAEQGKDGGHEEIAAEYLSHWFGEEVIAPVRLHVAAKRYLCATDTSYMSQLSPASIESLNIQGGPMSREEVSEFGALPHATLAVQLRRWDDQAKIPEFRVPVLQHYLPALRAASEQKSPSSPAHLTSG